MSYIFCYIFWFLEQFICWICLKVSSFKLYIGGYQPSLVRPIIQSDFCPNRKTTDLPKKLGFRVKAGIYLVGHKNWLDCGACRTGLMILLISPGLIRQSKAWSLHLGLWWKSQSSPESSVVVVIGGIWSFWNKRGFYKFDEFKLSYGGCNEVWSFMVILPFKDISTRVRSKSRNLYLSMPSSIYALSPTTCSQSYEDVWVYPSSHWSRSRNRLSSGYQYITGHIQLNIHTEGHISILQLKILLTYIS